MPRAMSSAVPGRLLRVDAKEELLEYVCFSALPFWVGLLGTPNAEVGAGNTWQMGWNAM